MEQFKWACGHSELREGKIHYCNSKSNVEYNNVIDASRNAIKNHKCHCDSVYVYSTIKGYIGLAQGLMFNNK